MEIVWEYWNYSENSNSNVDCNCNYFKVVCKYKMAALVANDNFKLSANTKWPNWLFRITNKAKP